MYLGGTCKYKNKGSTDLRLIQMQRSRQMQKSKCKDQWIYSDASSKNRIL